MIGKKLGEERKVHPRLTAVLQVALACIVQHSGFGQTNGTLPSFEVASVKLASPSTGGVVSMRHTLGPASLDYQNVRLDYLVREAFNLKPYQLAGPSWLLSGYVYASDKYVIRATFPRGTPTEQVSLMLRSLLIERLGMTFHREKRDVPVFELVVDNRGPRLKRPTREGMGHVERGSIQSPAMNLDSLADVLSAPLARPVLNKTNLDGLFEIDLTWAPDVAEPEPGGVSGQGPSVFSAMRDKLGLRLVATKAPIDVVVIDRLNKVPTED
jgi:uncharacterized protein (TIGR03435 family)